MDSQTYYNYKGLLSLQHDLALQELELKFKQWSYGKESEYSPLQQSIHKHQLLKQSINIDILKLDIELYKLNNKLE